MADPQIDLGAVAAAYPALAPHLKNAVAQWGKDQGDGRQLEFYPPWEGDNPNKGKTTLEFYNRGIPAEQLPDYAAADMLHYLSSSDPSTGKPVDQNWLMLRDQMSTSRTAKQRQADQNDWIQTDGKTPFDQYLSQNRLDAYMRGAAFPQINPEWNDYLTPQQKALGAQLQQYLKTPPQQ